jgi:hypothetical protein
MEISLGEYAGPKQLTALATQISGNTDNYLEINGMKTEISLQWRMVEYVKKEMGKSSDRWNVIDLEPDIDYSRISILQPSSDAIEIRYSGEAPGWIVLPMHLHHGWKAYIGNRQIRYDNYLGILPAIPVPGASQVMFRYEPRSFKIGVLVSSIGILLFIVFGVKCREKTDPEIRQ